MKVWIVTNNRAYLVGVFDTEEKAKAARLRAEIDGVVGPFVEITEMNKVRTGPETEYEFEE